MYIIVGLFFSIFETFEIIVCDGEEISFYCFLVIMISI